MLSRFAVLVLRLPGIPRVAVTNVKPSGAIIREHAIDFSEDRHQLGNILIWRLLKTKLVVNTFRSAPRAETPKGLIALRFVITASGSLTCSALLLVLRPIDVIALRI